jgi:hypothetical protein
MRGTANNQPRMMIVIKGAISIDPDARYATTTAMIAGIIHDK